MAIDEKFIQNIVINSLDDSIKDTGTMAAEDIKAWFKSKMNLDIDNKYIDQVLNNVHVMIGQIVSGVLVALSSSIAISVSNYLITAFAALKLGSRLKNAFKGGYDAWIKHGGGGAARYSVDTELGRTIIENSRKGIMIDHGLPDMPTTFAAGLGQVVAKGALSGFMKPDHTGALVAVGTYGTLVDSINASSEFAMGVVGAYTGLVDNSVKQHGYSTTKVPKNEMSDVLKAVIQLRNTRQVGG